MLLHNPQPCRSVCVCVWYMQQTVPDTDLLTCWADILISFRLPVRQIKYVFAVFL